nr:DUF3299 domain-containing protein [Oceanococcus sp. HetDA_MAG_MS8]
MVWRHALLWLFWGLPLSTLAEAPAPAQPDKVQDAEVFLQIFTESGYQNAQGVQVIDLLEGDYAYITLQAETIDGKAVVGATPELSLKGSSRIQSLTPPGGKDRTDDAGSYEFAVVGGSMGLDTLTIAVGKSTVQVQINVISLESAGFAPPASVEGSFPWDELLQASIEYGVDGAVRASFPSKLKKANGQTIKLAGFMMPLEPEAKQRHFLLTSSPPSCFFHIPGGPAGAVEVLAPRGVKASWDLLLLEGRLELLEHSEDGVIYRLHEAKALKL